METSRFDDQKRKESDYLDYHSTMIKISKYMQRFAAPKSFFTFHSQKWTTSFSYQLSISFTHGLQHYCFLVQANLNQPIGLRQMPRPIWTILLVQKWLQLGCKALSFQENWQERFPIDAKFYNGRSRFQPVLLNEESAGYSSRKLWKRGEIV